MDLLLKKINILIVGLFLSSTISSQQAVQIDWKADLEYLSTELPQKHFNLFHQKSELFFLSEIEKLQQKSENLTDFDIALKIQQLLASMGDSHTMLDYRPFLDKRQILPLQLYWFQDGLYVLRTTKENAEILGCKVLSINEKDVGQIADSLSSLITVDNRAVVKQNIPQMIPLTQILKCFKIMNNDHVELKYQAQLGKKKMIIIKPSVVNRDNITVYQPDSIAFCYKNQKEYFVDNYFENDEIYYLQYNRCHSKELELKYGNRVKAEKLPSFEVFEERVFNTLREKSINKLVFDLRFNAGGNSRQGTEFIRKLSEYLKINSNIKLYVILGQRTFSSAIINALDFKEMTNAIFVGEETGGKPNHFGELNFLTLPSSQLKIQYSTKYFKRIDEGLDTLCPDFLIETSFLHFSKGIDPVFDWIRSQDQ